MRRVLVVGQGYPWPATSGSFLRLTTVLSALAGLGEVEFFAFVYNRNEVTCDPPGEFGLVRVSVSTYPEPDLSARGRLRWARSSLPLDLTRMDCVQARIDFERWRRPSYDLVWFSKAGTFQALGRPRLGPTIVDLDDLEDHKLLARLAWADGYPQTPAGRLHRRAALAQGRLNASRWKRVQQEMASVVGAVAVCSEVDRERMGVRNAVVVPNGYEAPATPAGWRKVAGAPTVLLQGVLHYPPNSDAAQWLVREVAPLVRASRPETRIRLVGDSHSLVDALHDPPRVDVTGRVPSMLPELARADVVAVPIRYGSGTRVKILEAFAHGLPVVSTSLGAEGLGLEHGRHLLLADDAAAFAAAIVRLSTDEALRAHLTVQAHALFLERYQWSRARAAITETGLAVMAEQVGSS